MVQKRLSRLGTPPEKQRVLDRKRAILWAASVAFRERGFHRAGMREIASALGMTVGNLYYYFSSKQELLAFCQQEALGRLLALAEQLEGEDLAAPQRLYSWVLGHVQILNEDTPGSLAHLEIESVDESSRARLQGLRDLYEGKLREVIEDGVRTGLFRAVDPKVAAFALLGACNWTVKWYDPAGDRELHEIGREFAEHLVRGLMTDPKSFVPLAEPVQPRAPDRLGEWE